MVFSSLPSYHHDQPNWQQQPANHSGASSQLLHAPPPPLPQPHGVGGAGSIRPGSMADRARMANIPLPEPALKCPRCDSTNTKFCYFNNYSLTQPRHFCKTCRRYWTRGGALRTVPVGGGCRRNKRSKSTGGGSKNPSASDRQSTGAASSGNSSGAIQSTAEMLGLPALRFMAPLHHPALAEFSPVSGGEIGLNYAGLTYGGNFSAQLGMGTDLSFHVGNASAPPSLGSMAEQWRLQPPQFPFLPSGLDPSPAGLFEGEAASFSIRTKATSSGITDQMASVKMEDSNSTQAEMNLSRQFFGGADHYWNGGGGNGGSSVSAWTDFSGFSSSSTTSNQL